MSMDRMSGEEEINTMRMFLREDEAQFLMWKRGYKKKRPGSIYSGVSIGMENSGTKFTGCGV
jgi:hypothetical protein